MIRLQMRGMQETKSATTNRHELTREDSKKESEPQMNPPSLRNEETTPNQQSYGEQAVDARRYGVVKSETVITRVYLRISALICGWTHSLFLRVDLCSFAVCCFACVSRLDSKCPAPVLAR